MHLQVYMDLGDIDSLFEDDDDDELIFTITCCTIHNFIKLHAHQDLLFHEFNDELLIIDDDNVQNTGSNTQMSINVRQNEAMLMDQVRDQIADRLWTAFEH